MFVCYLDESYNRGQSYWLAAALLPASRVVGLNNAVDVAARMLVEHGIDPMVELHGTNLFHALRECRPLHGSAGIESRLAVFRGVFRALEAAEGRLIMCGVDWNAGPGSGDLDLHRMEAMEHFLPTLQTALQALDTHALVIADEERGTAREVLSAVRRHKAGLTSANVEPRLVDNILFLPSHDSRGIQALDLVAFLHRRLDAGEDARSPKKSRLLRETRRLQSIYSPLVLDSSKHPAPRSP